VSGQSILLAFVVAGAALALALFGLPPGAFQPPDSALPFFAPLVVLESIAFGVGVAYAARSRNVLFRRGRPALERAVAACVAYLLLAPWPHDRLHQFANFNGVYNWPFLAGIEYVFHLGIVPVGLLVAAYLRRMRTPRASLSDSPELGRQSVGR